MQSFAGLESEFLSLMYNGLSHFLTAMIDVEIQHLSTIQTHCRNWIYIFCHSTHFLFEASCFMSVDTKVIFSTRLFNLCVEILATEGRYSVNMVQ